MILGVGIDIIDINRIERLLDEKFLARVFTDNERRKCDARKERAACYSKRFAAKEAIAKALGCGIGADAFFSDIEIINNERGVPQAVLSGRALERLSAITPTGYISTIFLALSDELPYAIAQATIEALPA